MSQSDPGETTDTCSTSGSGSISDWALVNEQGHLQDDDSESTSSSVEVMEGEDEEEDVDPITPVPGNSPPGAITQPMFVLRLASHQVLDTDEETSVRTGESVADSNSTDLTTDTSSGPASSLTAAGSQAETLVPATVTESQAETRVPATVTESQAETRVPATVTESQAETLVPATATESSASQMKPNLGRGVSQEDLDSLRRAIDDVQTDLLQSQAASHTLSSFEMFGPEIQEAENSEPSTSTPAEAVEDVPTKGDDTSKAADQEAGVAPPEAAAMPPEPVPGPGGQVAVDDRTGDQEVEMLGPARETQLVVHTPRESWMRKIIRFLWRAYQLYREMRSEDGLLPWFLGGYVFLLSVIVCLLGLISYLSVSQGFTVKTAQEQSECPAYLTIDWKKDWSICQGRLINVQKDLEKALAKQRELDADMRECLGRDWWSLERAQYQRELDRESHQQELDDLVKQRNELKEELGTCQKQRRSDSLYADLYSHYEASDDTDDSKAENKREPLQNIDQSARETVNQSDEDIVDQSVKIDEDQSKTRRNQRTKRESSKEDENVEDKPKESYRKKKPKDQQNKKARGRRDSQESYRGETPETEEEFTESDNTSGNWMENIFDIMNKTKDQIQETWSQVRNMSDHLWKKHSPTMDRLQNKFVRKVKKLSQKLKSKIEKKTKKWFGGEEKAADDDKEDRDKEKADRAKAETKRRPHKEHDNPKTATTMCDPAVMELSRKFKTMNANKYHNKMTGQCRRTIKQTLRELSEDRNILADEVLGPWVMCQGLFWQHDGKGTIGDGCEAYLSCWQVRVASGDVKKCRKLKMETGNILDGRCPVGPMSEEEVWPDKKLNCNSRPAGDGRKQKQTFHDRDKLDDDDNDDDDDDDDDDDLWLMARAEDRQYHRDEPDDWYFRRTKDSPPVLPKTYSQYQSDFYDYLDIDG